MESETNSNEQQREDMLSTGMKYAGVAEALDVFNRAQAAMPTYTQTGPVAVNAISANRRERTE